MFDHEFLQHVMIPFSITKYQLEYANRLPKNKALQNILLLLFAVRLEFTAAKTFNRFVSSTSYLHLTSQFNIYYPRYSVKLLLYNFFSNCLFYNYRKNRGIYWLHTLCFPILFLIGNCRSCLAAEQFVDIRLWTKCRFFIVIP